MEPTIEPTFYPTPQPSAYPTHNPTDYPSIVPTGNPSLHPTIYPTSPTSQPTTAPTSTCNSVTAIIPFQYETYNKLYAGNTTQARVLAKNKMSDVIKDMMRLTSKECPVQYYAENYTFAYVNNTFYARASIEICAECNLTLATLKYYYVEATSQRRIDAEADLVLIHEPKALIVEYIKAPDGQVQETTTTTMAPSRAETATTIIERDDTSNDGVYVDNTDEKNDGSGSMVFIIIVAVPTLICCVTLLSVFIFYKVNLFWTDVTVFLYVHMVGMETLHHP